MIEDFNKPDSDVFLFILSTRAGGQVLCCVCVCVCVRARARACVLCVLCVRMRTASPPLTHILSSGREFAIGRHSDYIRLGLESDDGRASTSLHCILFFPTPPG